MSVNTTQSIYAEISTQVTPTLAIVQVGNDPASNIYIKYKKQACEKLGFGFQLLKFNETTTPQLIKELDQINTNPNITGCIVQLPLPPHIDKYQVLNHIHPDKDVDCFNFENIGKLYLGIQHAKYIPATAYGIYKYIKHNNIQTKGKICVIIGKSIIVGKPLQLLLSAEDDCAATTILCDKYTQNIDTLTKQADILIVCAGVHHLINTPQNIKQGATIIDVGIHKVTIDNKTKIQGDVDFNAVKSKCNFITPVPGGVGPMTIAALMHNLAKSSRS